MKKGFTLVELIVSIALITIISFSVLFLRKLEPTYADPYENIRQIVADASSIFLNLNVGYDYKKELETNHYLEINTDLLIEEGLLEETYYVDNLNENLDMKNIVIIISKDEEGFLDYAINIEKNA